MKIEDQVDEFLEKYGSLLRDLPADMKRISAAMDESLVNGTVYRADLVEILRPVNILILGIVMTIDSTDTELIGTEEVIDEVMTGLDLWGDVS